MADYLMRDQAPLTAEQWEHIDKVVTEVAQRTLVGRRFIPIFGPLGVGIQVIPKPAFYGAEAGVEELSKEKEARAAKYIPLYTIQRDFVLHWRELETSKQLNMPLELGPAAASAAFCAQAEDNLIFNGNRGLGCEGLLNAEGRNLLPLSDWTATGNAFRDVVAATEKLLSAGFFGPYAAVLSPQLYAAIHKVYENTSVLEIEQVRKIITDGVYYSPSLLADSGLIVATGLQNMDLVIAQDLVTAFLETSNMDHRFRVLEILALRIKRPGAICVLEGGPA
ncbi:MAG: bacteriocin family protein [Chloroflexi bacterium]|nr:bacteriocin family protein [Chloroflexota bacterium]MCL5074894.1 bacteriocin family protein [Chloroflexota bacterium]